jgi:hypothetical protein
MPHVSFWSRLRRRVESTLVEAEEVFNQLTDSDRQWWPFAFLRPAQHEAFSTLRVAALAVLHGVPIGLILLLVDHRARHAAGGGHIALFLAVVCAAVFVTNRFTLAYFWNRRANRIVERRGRFGIEG